MGPMPEGAGILFASTSRTATPLPFTQTYFIIIAPVVSAVTTVYSEYYLEDLLSFRLAIKLHKNYVRHMIV